MTVSNAHAWTDDECWGAITARDASAAGRFVVAVRTTGIYCAPGCPARTPKRENVAFFGTWTEAERAGYRPCKRCRPRPGTAKTPTERAIAAACRHIDEAEEPPTLADLSAAVGLSPGHLQRSFKRRLGLSPREYALAQRARRLRGGLEGGGSVTAAIVGAGFGSASRVYENTAGLLGMRPSTYKNGGAGERVRYAVADSSLGSVLVAATDRGVCAIDLGDGPEPLAVALRRRFPSAVVEANDAAFRALVDRVVALVEDPGTPTDLPLDVRGTAFQGRVWHALRRIPPGGTISYADLAARIGEPTATRAVANACGANPVPLAVPCHRVVRADGGLGGYRLGVERKRALLEREAATGESAA